LLAAVCFLALMTVANAQTILYERLQLAIHKEIKVPTEGLLDEMWKECKRLIWYQERDCKDKISRIKVLLEDTLAKARPIVLQIDFEETVARRKKIDETIADINMTMRSVDGYIRNIRRKFSDHLATIFPEPIE
jgi:hypothetical protein